jgi:hypothetical protein
MFVGTMVSVLAAGGAHLIKVLVQLAAVLTRLTMPSVVPTDS